MKNLVVSLVIAGAVGTAGVALLADDYERERDSDEHESYTERDGDHGRGAPSYGYGAPYLSDTQYALYKTECGSCHMAFPPSTLPSASWQGMMGSLGDHFGDNAELDAATAGEIAGFLVRHAAGQQGGGEYAERTWRSTRGRTAPLRITETDYFRGKHHEITAKMVRDNAEVVSFARCDACHSGAERGDFAEDRVRIPGFGRWDD